MRYFKNLFCFIFFLSPVFIFSQDDTGTAKSDEAIASQKREYYVFSPRVSIDVPHPISNKAFRKTFVGVYDLSAGMNFMIFKGAFVGINYKNSLLKVFENKVADLDANMQSNSAGIRIGSDFYVGSKNRMIFSASVGAGQNWSNYSKFRSKTILNKPTIYNFNTTYIEPEVSFYFLIEQNFAIGINLNYTMLNQKFDPYELCLNEWAQYDKENSGNISFLNFGFGFYYSFLQKKDKK